MAVGIFILLTIMLFVFLVFVSVGTIVAGITQRLAGRHLLSKRQRSLNVTSNAILLLAVSMLLSMFTSYWDDVARGIMIIQCLVLSLLLLGSASLAFLSRRGNAWNKVTLIMSVIMGTLFLTPPFVYILRIS